MADTPATTYSDIMALLQSNQGGAVLSLPAVTLLGSRLRHQVSTITLASQLSGAVTWVGRIPLFSVLRSIDCITDTSLGSSTIAFGDAHDTNSAIYGAAATFTATNTLTRFGPPLAKCGVPITTGYDHAGVLVTANMPQTPGPDGGFLFEDINLIVGAATMPASGTLRVLISYAID